MSNINAKWLERALRLLDRKEFHLAHEESIEQIKLDHARPEAYLILAEIAAIHRNHEKAPELYTRALDFSKENSAVFRVCFAKYRQSRGDHVGAAQLLKTVTPTAFTQVRFADDAGVVLSRAGQHAQALAYFYRAIELDSSFDNVFYNLGASLQFLGRFEDAEGAYRAAIELNPKAYRAYTALVGLGTQREDRNFLPQLQTLFEQTDDADARLHIGHAIAKTLEDLNRFPESLNWLADAKSAKRTSLDYTFDQDNALFEAAKLTLVTGQALSTATATTTANKSHHEPLFIVGLPRTGTTLFDRILSSHPDVVSVGEQNAFAAIIKQKAGTTSPHVLDPETLEAAQSMGLEGVAEEYCSAIAHLVPAGCRPVDKMPLNFFYVGLILKAFPKARVVALRRHPLDSCLSNYRQLFSTGFSYYNYSLSVSNTARYYRCYDGFMALCRARLSSHQFMEFHYDQLVTNQEAETRRLLEFAGLPWDAACLDFHENRAAVSTASSVQVRQRLYTSSLNRWRRYGDSIESLKEQLSDLLTDEDAKDGMETPS